MTLQSDTPFDQYTRQKIVSEALNSIRVSVEKFSILDVGGYKGKTQVFLPEDEVIVADILDVVEENYVQTSALNMPFETNSYDFVVSFDALEHVSAKDRKKFMSECLRVSRRGVIICAPHLTVKNKAAELRLNHLYKTISGQQHRWLREHIENGLPDFSELDKLSKKEGFFTRMAFSNDIGLWMAMQAALFTNEVHSTASDKLIALNKQYNVDLDTDLQVGEDDAYRQIFFAFKNKVDINKLDVFIDGQCVSDQRQQKIDIMYKIFDYYVELVKTIDNKYHDENSKNNTLTDELNNTRSQLSAILSSRSWRYLRKIVAIKTLFIGK